MTELIATRADFDFYLCTKCGRICTRLEMDAALGAAGRGTACPCGGVKYSPVDVTWRDYVLPQVIKFTRSLLGEGADAALIADLELEARADGLTDAAIADKVAAVQAAQQALV